MRKRDSALALKLVMVKLCFEFVIRDEAFGWMIYRCEEIRNYERDFMRG